MGMWSDWNAKTLPAGVSTNMSTLENYLVASTDPKGLPRCTDGKEATCQCRRQKETWAQSLDREDLLQEGMAALSSILASRIPWTEKPGGLQSIELQRVGHD